VKIDFDVDIDMANRDELLKLLKYTSASIVKDGEFTKHNTGVYLQNIPFDPLKQISDIDHKQAEEEGWFKLDVLNNSVYTNIKDETHLNKLLKQEPMWELLQHKDIVEQLFHINNHYDIVSQYTPTSVSQLAMILAMIRPGKRYLVGKDWQEIEADVWTRPEDGTYFFKKSHAFAYALTIVVQLNLICEQAATDLS
jgi:hypothetical protein